MKPTKKSYDDSRSRSNETMKTPALTKSKYYIRDRLFITSWGGVWKLYPPKIISYENWTPPPWRQEFLKCPPPPTFPRPRVLTIWQKIGPLILAVSDITTTVAPLTHRWQRRKKTNCLLHFRVLNLKNLSMNPAMMGSQEQTIMNSR